MICLKSNQKGCIVITFFRAFHYICIIQDAFGIVKLKTPFSFASALDFCYIWIIQDASR